MTCKFPGCDHETFAAGYCHGHYAQRRRGVPLAALRGHGEGLQLLTLRLRPATIAALGPDARSRARELLELVTSTRR